MSAAKAVVGVAVLLTFAGCIRASTDADEHDLNDKFLDTLIKTKDSRSFLNDLIYKIQLLLNDTDEPQHTTLAAPKSPKDTATRWAAKSRLPQVTLGPIGEASLFNFSLESLLALPANITLDALQIFNQTSYITNETVVDMAAEREAKRNAMGQDASQRVATLGVIICLTFVGTATCIVVMALYSSKFSGIILLSNGRWWCPMVTRGNGVERQLLV
ncbi:hypothetical protein HPB49_015845 [Dermacentor silvarum]|uniref:Uncharacterized protein n=1 Tax=Dermacentor silvarum TaxID=543639 RepID=A0ACB8C4C3_DERSI|nr:hypothetical protein HPB49_015845 [Dermacentor silvarum]